MAKTAVKYDEKSIQTLDALEHIRLRTGMYIGRLGDGSNPMDGIYILLKEIIDNSVDEFIMGQGKIIEILRKKATVSVRDYGRGIPLGKVIDCVSKVNTGGKFNDDLCRPERCRHEGGQRALRGVRGCQLPGREVRQRPLP